MNHCVNCDFHLPQRYVAACPYCGLDPKKLDAKPTASNLDTEHGTKMTLEPLSETLLSFGCKSAASSSAATNAFTTAQSFPASANTYARSNARNRSAQAHRSRSQARNRRTGDFLFGKVVMVVALITLATLAFEFRHLLAAVF